MAKNDTPLLLLEYVESDGCWITCVVSEPPSDEYKSLGRKFFNLLLGTTHTCHRKHQKLNRLSFFLSPSAALLGACYQTNLSADFIGRHFGDF